MATAFATLEEYEARYGEVASEDEDAVNTLLEDAANFILTTPGYHPLPEGHPLYQLRLHALSRVTCAMVHRILAAGSELVGFNSYTQTAGDYSATVQLSNPSGDMYLTAAEKRSLGIGVGRVGQTL